MQTTWTRNQTLVALLVIAFAAGPTVSGCGATCDRIEQDRKEFFARPAATGEPHAEVLVPFALAEGLIDQQIDKVKPIDVKIPGLGEIGSYFGKLSVAPRRVQLLPAAEGHIGFRLHFDVRAKGKQAFGVSLATEVEPEVDLAQGRVGIGFGKEELASAEPEVSDDAKRKLGGMIYDRIPKLARLLVPRKLVDKAATSTVDYLVDKFYDLTKDKLLDQLGALSQLAFDLPDIPARALTIRSYKEQGGALQLLIETGLPVKAPIAPTVAETAPASQDLIAVRMSGSAMAELVNWAIAKELVPTRYDQHGKAKKNGELRPGLDWVPGKRPMKIYLWDLERPCMRIKMGANAKVATVDGEIRIEATGGKIEDVEASAFTKVGVWFHALWKDAVNVTKSAGTEMSFSVAGQRMTSRLERAAIEDDELILGLSLSAEETQKIKE